MSLFEKKDKILVTCSKRTSAFLRKEIEDLGYPVISETETFIETTGTMQDCMRLNLFVRSAHRVLFHIKDFRAQSPDSLYSGFKKIEWEEYFSADEYFSISSYAEHPDVKDSRYPSLRAKDAIADHFREKFNKRPDSGPEMKGVMIFFYWVEGLCSVYFDTSGPALSKRNYRKIPFKAPMQESLAASVILASGWNGEENFINPMCGSGTLAIEAALIALNRAPGLFKGDFAFMHLKGFSQETWKTIRQEARAKGKKSFSGKIIASDISHNAIDASKQNAKTAGVDHLIEFHICDFRETPVPEGNGVVVLNPEYGERLGEERALEEVYKGIGDFFKQKCKGYMGYVFTGNLQLAKHIGLRSKRRIPFFNGPIDCRLIEFELYEGTRKIKES